MSQQTDTLKANEVHLSAKSRNRWQLFKLSAVVVYGFVAWHWVQHYMPTLHNDNRGNFFWGILHGLYMPINFFEAILHPASNAITQVGNDGIPYYIGFALGLGVLGVSRWIRKWFDNQVKLSQAREAARTKKAKATTAAR